jgi:glycolate oxidase iron-sulfur subunit
MLENDKPASSEVALHIDRCLSCLSCMTTCPSASITCTWSTRRGVRIEDLQAAPLQADKAGPRTCSPGCCRRAPFRVALVAPAGRPFAPLLDGLPPGRPRLMLRLAPVTLRGQRGASRPGGSASGPRRARVALLTGCASTCSTRINAATVRLLNRFGVEVVFPRGGLLRARSSTTWAVR